MFTAHLIVTIAAAAWVGFSGFSLFRQSAFVVKPLTDYGVPRAWWPWLAAAKSAGAVGLLAGLYLPAIGFAAGIGLVLYFLGAVVTVLRAKSYATVVFPILYLVPVMAALTLSLLV